MPGPENRKEPRLPHGTEVQIEDEGEFLEKFSGNISRGGIFVQTPRPLPMGREVVLRIALSGGGYLEAMGTVAWARHDEDPETGEPPGMGIQFKRLPPGIEVLVDRVVTAGESRTTGGGGSSGIRCLLVQLRRNRKGETVREGRMLHGETLSIGRASEKDIHLADPRVALNHAVIRAKAFGVLTLESAGPDLRVNGSFCQNADLAIGMEIDIGSFRLVVEAPNAEGAAEHDLCLTLERVQPVIDASAAKRKRRPIATTLAGTRLSMRRSALLFAGLVGLIFLVLPALQAASPAARARFKDAGVSPSKSWNPGLVAAGHRSIAEDCTACHATPFAPVKDAQCVVCHATAGNHIRSAALNASVMGDTRCAECHREHRGARSMAERDPKLCVECHATLKSDHPEAAMENISGFSGDHPAFRPTMRVGKEPGDVIRIAQGSPAPQDDGLHFSHATHLSKEGVRTPNAPAGSNGTVVLQCEGCHELESTRHFYQPVSMEKHCAGCHRLDFEPGRTSRQVPHGSVEGVLTTLREFYAGVALGTTPVASPVPRPGMFGRPGSKRIRVAAEPTASVEWVLANAERAANDLFEKRVCHDCHEIERQSASPGDPAGIAGVTWRVKSVVQTDRWLPRNEFEHSRHASAKCETCHAASASKLASDVLLPSIAVCRSCHVSVPEANKVTSGCESCHGYHVHATGTLAASDAKP